MRAGAGTGLEANSSTAAVQNQFIGTSMGLLRVFSEEAVKVAGEYALAQGRSKVSNEDMQKALKYQARMFFQQVENLDGRVHEAAREVLARAEEEEEEEEESEEEDEDEEEGEEANDEGEEVDDETKESGDKEQAVAAASDEEEPAAEDDDDATSSTSNSKSTVSTASAASLASSVVASVVATQAEAVRGDAELAHCRATARRVDAIVASWDRFQPDDPVLVMIKNAIDATATMDPCEEGADSASPLANKRQRR